MNAQRQTIWGYGHPRPTWSLSAIAVMVVAVLALGLPSAARAGTGDWPMWGDGPKHNAVNRDEATLGLANVAGLHVVRVFPGGDPTASDLPYEVVVGNIGYTVIGQYLPSGEVETYLWAFNLTSGVRLWAHRISADDNSWHYSAAVSNGIVYIGGDSAMHAFNASTGAVMWTTSVPFAHGSVPFFNQTTVTNGLVYATTYGRRVYAFDAASGRVVWSRTPPGCCLTGSVSVAKGISYLLDGSLTAYNATTGAHLFSVGASQYGTPVVSNGVVYIVTDTRPTRLIARSASTGTRLWSAAVPTPLAGVLGTSPAVDGKTVVVGSTRYVTAYNSATGARRWSFDSGNDHANYSVPAIANGVVYVTGSTVGLQAINETNGAVVYERPNYYCRGPIVSHARVYASCYDAGSGAARLIAFGI